MLGSILPSLNGLPSEEGVQIHAVDLVPILQFGQAEHTFTRTTGFEERKCRKIVLTLKYNSESQITEETQVQERWRHVLVHRKLTISNVLHVLLLRFAFQILTAFFDARNRHVVPMLENA